MYLFVWVIFYFDHISNPFRRLEPLALLQLKLMLKFKSDLLIIAGRQRHQGVLVLRLLKMLVLGPRFRPHRRQPILPWRPHLGLLCRPLLMQKVVCGGRIIMLVQCQGFHCVLDIKWLKLPRILHWVCRDFVLLDHIKDDLGVYLDFLGILIHQAILLYLLLIALGSWGLLLATVLFKVIYEPWMAPNLHQSISFLGVHVQDLLDQVSGRIGDEIRNAIIAIQNLLIKLICIWVFEWQIAAEHREENDSARPNVDLEPNVLLASDHLRGCIARTSTGCLKCFMGWRVQIGQAKINNLQIV
jgi:hypothetical protein